VFISQQLLYTKSQLDKHKFGSGDKDNEFGQAGGGIEIKHSTDVQSTTYRNRQACPFSRERVIALTMVWGAVGHHTEFASLYERSPSL